ncbi:MAG: glutathione S-transferase family protein [Deltaproteobacteria bacterium]|nr:glutathione S-transferase family protein [Deltaproteobacteria bacterium]
MPKALNATAAPYVLQGFDVSYFTAIVRVALRYKGLWVDEQHADIRDILKRTGMAFIPIVVTPEGDTWQDSTEIIERLEARHPDPPLIPRTPLQHLVANLIELYANEFGLLPAMHYRWGSELADREVRTRFAAMIGRPEQSQKAGDQMAQRRLDLGATEEAAPVIEAHTHDLLEAMNAHLEQQLYLLGGRLSLADCALMGPFYAHLAQDVVSRQLLIDRASPVLRWIEFCNYPSTHQTAWLEGDQVPESLVALLGAMGRDAAPAIAAQTRAFQAWCEAHPAERRKPPRNVGTFEWELRGTPMRGVVGGYGTWMVQRSLDAYASLGEAKRSQADALLEGTGWPALLELSIVHRMKKEGFELRADE